MAFSISFDLDDIRAQSAMARLAAASDDMMPFMDSVGQLLVDSAKERIGVTNLGPDGAVWPQSFRARLDGGKTLRQDGFLLDSIARSPAPDHVLVGSNLPYAAVHQFGAVIRAKSAEGLSFTLADGSHHVVSQVTIPARPYIGISVEDEATIFDLVEVHFSDIVAGMQ